MLHCSCTVIINLLSIFSKFWNLILNILSRLADLDDQKLLKTPNFFKWCSLLENPTTSTGGLQHIIILPTCAILRSRPVFSVD